MMAQTCVMVLKLELEDDANTKENREKIWQKVTRNTRTSKLELPDNIEFKLMTIGGNHFCRALKELVTTNMIDANHYSHVPCILLHPDTPAQNLQHMSSIHNEVGDTRQKQTFASQIQTMSAFLTHWNRLFPCAQVVPECDANNYTQKFWLSLCRSLSINTFAYEKAQSENISQRYE